ncbi:MAG: electron transfer flavoprotein subunit alpha/FixB family protein [Sediminispirochaetaceae bacterium]
MRKVLIYLDPDAVKASIDLLDATEQMYGPGGFESYGLCIGDIPEETRGIFDFLVRVPEDLVPRYDAMNIAACIGDLHAEYEFDAILIPASCFGRMIAPRAAMRLRSGLVADVTAIRHRDGEVEMVRPAFSGRMLAGIVKQGRTPVMMSVRQSVFAFQGGKTKDTGLIEYTPGSSRASRSPQSSGFPRGGEKPGVRLLETRAKNISEDIRESEILISGGGGIQRHFDQLEELARELGGMVSASRKAVDSGAAPRHIQVGQSGRTVSPRLYFAIGISGSIQHVVGLKNAEFIISVNADPRAPICSLSDIVVEGDARDFLRRMLERIKKDGQ